MLDRSTSNYLTEYKQMIKPSVSKSMCYKNLFKNKFTYKLFT